MKKTARRIVLAGGSGQVGTLLAKHFCSHGDDVVVLSRRKFLAPWRVTKWDATKFGPWVQDLERADILVNLTGRSVNCRYNSGNRREILESRVASTGLLGKALTQLAQPPPLWLNASTATIYRHALDRPMDESTGELGGGEPNAPDTWKFSIDVAKQWESAFFAPSLPATRRVALRSAMVMSPDPGGIFDTLLRLVHFGLGGPAGTGRQFISWIHERDFIRAIEHLIAHTDMHGCINLSSPNPLPNVEFMHELRQVCGTPIALPATRWMLELGAIILRTETELVLKSRRVVPIRLLQSGFHFDFPEWKNASADLVQRSKNLHSQTLVQILREDHSTI
jgi:uncharacterized protein (TIGR01777 family)